MIVSLNGALMSCKMSNLPGSTRYSAKKDPLFSASLGRYVLSHRFLNSELLCFKTVVRIWGIKISSSISSSSEFCNANKRIYLKFAISSSWLSALFSSSAIVNQSGVPQSSSPSISMNGILCEHSCEATTLHRKCATGGVNLMKLRCTCGTETKFDKLQKIVCGADTKMSDKFVTKWYLYTTYTKGH